MKSWALQHFPWPNLTSLGLIIFCIFFITVIVQVFRMRPQDVTHAKSLPLREDIYD